MPCKPRRRLIERSHPGVAERVGLCPYVASAGALFEEEQLGARCVFSLSQTPVDKRTCRLHAFRCLWEILDNIPVCADFLGLGGFVVSRLRSWEPVVSQQGMSTKEMPCSILPVQLMSKSVIAWLRHVFVTSKFPRCCRQSLDLVLSTLRAGNQRLAHARRQSLCVCVCVHACPEAFRYQ